MTSKKFGIALISLFVLSILAVAPAMAAAYGNVVAQGETVFIGESGLDMTTIVTPGNVYHYAAGSSVGDAPDMVMPFPDNTSVAISSGYSTGGWYNTSTLTVANLIFYVQEPSLKLSLWNPATNVEISGKKVISGQDVAIRVDTNLAALFNRASVKRASNSGIATGIDVNVITPDGATLSGLINTSGTVTNLTGVQPTNTVYFLNTNGTVQTGAMASNAIWNFNTARYSAGEYQIYAETNINSLKDNLGTVTDKTVSATKTLTLDKETVSITADKETVIRNNDFAVTIEGAPKTEYFLWISGTNGYDNATDYPPMFTENQVDVSYLTGTPGATPTAEMATLYKTGTAVAADVVPNVYVTTTNVEKGNVWSVKAKTGSDGKITVGLTTTDKTKAATYTIRAQ